MTYLFHLPNKFEQVGPLLGVDCCLRLRIAAPEKVRPNCRPFFAKCYKNSPILRFCLLYQEYIYQFITHGVHFGVNHVLGLVGVLTDSGSSFTVLEYSYVLRQLGKENP